MPPSAVPTRLHPLDTAIAGSTVAAFTRTANPVIARRTSPRNASGSLSTTVAQSGILTSIPINHGLYTSVQ